MTDTVTIGLAGDVMLGRMVNATMAERGPLYPWGNMRRELAATDAVVINLECALTHHREEWTDRYGRHKTFYFRADPATGAACLRRANLTAALIANNHAADYGTAGLLDTVATLDAAGILHAGAGATLWEAAEPARIIIGGLRVALLAFSDHPAAWAATERSPGIHLLPEPGSPASVEAVTSAITRARSDADIVVCSLHWGPNMRPAPTRAFRSFARVVIDAGADVLFGHSAHVVQGIEIYHGRPILYDTGDFVDDYAVDERLRNDLSALFTLKIQHGKIECIELVPVEIGNCQVNHASPPARDWFAERFQHLCESFGTRVQDTGDRLRIDL